MRVKLYNQKGEEIGKVELPDKVFGVPMNADLLHQAVNAQMANARKVIARTKDKSEVRGGGRKPWRQKGTGRARHGSIRSPIWKGGGVTFGPTKERNFAKKINKKMRRKALFTALSSKVRDGEMIVLDKLQLTEAKTKQMVEVLTNLEQKTEKKLLKGILVILPASNQEVVRAVRNIPKATVVKADGLNVLNVLSHKYLLMVKGVEKIIEKVYTISSKLKAKNAK